MTRVEMLLYHGLPPTSRLEVSTTSDTGPWTALDLTATRGLLAALAEWEQHANAEHPERTWYFSYELAHSRSPTVWLHATGGVAWVRLSASLADLLGFSGLVQDVTTEVGSDRLPLSVLENDLDRLAVGISWPIAVDQAELSEYRAARASSYHFGRALEVLVDLYVPPDVWPDVETSPLVTGHAAMRIERDDPDPWGPDHPEGVLVLYPIETVSVEHPVAEEHVWIRLRCTMEDL